MTDPRANPSPPRVQATAIPQSRRRLHERRTVPTSTPVRAALAHPLIRRNYRVATVAIEHLIDLIEHCVSLLIPGALIHARPRMGKTHAIDYAGIHLARHRPDILVLRMSCEHHRTQFEGAFFDSLLAAAGVRDSEPSITEKRFALIRRLTEQLQVKQGYIVVLYCDEAQRLSRHALEWLRDVHDQLGLQGYRLVTFLVGQPQLMEQKAQYQLTGDEQIVARFMIEKLHFRGITDARDAATCLESYDLTRYPEETGPFFTEYFVPLAWAAGLRLVRSAAHLWDAFARAHKTAQLPGDVEIQMDYFTRAIESVLKSGPDWDSIGLELTEAHWEKAVRDSGYVAAQQTFGPST